MGLFSEDAAQTYKSDRFHLLHPYGFYTVEQASARDDIGDFVVSCKTNAGRIFMRETERRKWRGGVLVFPRVEDPKVEKAVARAVKSVVGRLKKEYEDADDRFDDYTVAGDGSVFAADFRNRATKEKFGIGSVAVCFRGTSSYTLDYLAERIYDRVRSSCGPVLSMLVCDMNDGDFYQYSVSESYIYRRPFRERRRI